MRRLRLYAAGVVALALLTAACGSDSKPAAVVNGHKISQNTVIDELEAIAGNQAYVEAFEATEAQVRGSEAGTFSAPFAAVVLTRQIYYELIRQEVKERDLDVADECKNAGQADLTRQVAELVGDDGQRSQAVLDAFPSDYRETLERRFTEELVLQADLLDQPCVVDDAARDYFKDHADDFKQACLSLITVSDEATAASAKRRLDAGRDFAALAKERSTDPSAPNGGDAGCLDKATIGDPALTEAVFAAEPGAVAGPVASGEGAAWHVFVVRELRDPPFDEVADQVRQTLGSHARDAVRQWATKALTEAEVEADPQYGRWDAKLGSIVAPDAESVTTTEAGGQ